MKSINKLIKIHSSELDELRKQTKNCEEEKEMILFYKNKMASELEIEYALVTQNPEIGITFSNYKKMLIERQETIKKSLLDIEKRLEYLKEQIAIKFGEVKKYEILLANQINEERKKQLSAEIMQMDEIAINNYLNDTNNG